MEIRSNNRTQRGNNAARPHNITIYERTIMATITLESIEKLHAYCEGRLPLKPIEKEELVDIYDVTHG